MQDKVYKMELTNTIKTNKSIPPLEINYHLNPIFFPNPFIQNPILPPVEPK